VTVVDDAGNPVDGALTVAEADPALGELNPFFDMPVSGGKGGFHAQQGLRYTFTAPPNGPWIVSSVSVGGKTAPTPGAFFTFDQPSTEIRVILKRR
jgi:hypothetical protein